MPVKRRERGTLVDGVSMNLEVERPAKKKFEDIAKRSGLSRALFFEGLMANIELTSQGIPPWVPPLDRDGELPIEDA
jgi:hypothetical protein